jgi:lipopolysaccharide export LptBFGC system permease protein LptF
MISNFVRAGAAGLIFAFVATDAASAGIGLPTPGPMIGAGAPALALFGAGYWLLRRRRRG